MEILQKGRSAFERGEYKRAITLVDQAIKQNPYDRHCRHVRALSYFKLGEYITAIEEFNWLVEHHPEETEYLSDRGVAHHRNEDNTTALADFERALLLEPERGYHYACRAYIKDKMGDVEGAVADYKKAIQLDPQDEISKNNLEISQQKLGYKASKLFRYKSKAHFSEEEQQAYQAEYEAKHGKAIPPTQQHPPAPPTTRDMLREMGKVFTSKAAFKEFVQFITKRKTATSQRAE